MLMNVSEHKTGARSRMGRMGVALGIMALAVSACAKGGASYQASTANDYDVRHPITLGDQVQHLDVFRLGATLGPRQLEEIRVFAQAARATGGQIEAAVPEGAEGQALMAQVRAVLVKNGVKQAVAVRSYPSNSALGAGPVRLSRTAFKAYTTQPCGQWPRDALGVANFQSITNLPYDNFGCAQQSMMAAQVADPLDHVRSMPEGRMDAQRQVKNIEKLRAGASPSIQWSTGETSVGSN